MKTTDTVHCAICPRSWPRDPVLEVACPRCNAPIGRWCRRPSGHNAWEPWGPFHAARDLAADAAGHYGPRCDQCQTPATPVQLTLDSADTP